MNRLTLRSPETLHQQLTNLVEEEEIFFIIINCSINVK